MGSISSRLAVAVHILGYLVRKGEEPTPSPEIASSVNTNPVVVRRLIGLLREAGLVSVQQGAAGGAVLAKPPEEITLLDVYQAVDPPDELFSMHAHCPDRGCGIGAHIQATLRCVFGRAESALEKELARVTVRDVYRDVSQRARTGVGIEQDSDVGRRVGWTVWGR